MQVGVSLQPIFERLSQELSVTSELVNFRREADFYAEKSNVAVEALKSASNGNTVTQVLKFIVLSVKKLCFFA